MPLSAITCDLSPTDEYQFLSVPRQLNGHSELGGCFSTIALFQKKAGVAVLGL